MGYTYEELVKKGATPGVSSPVSSSSAPKKKYTYEELVAQGATPTTPSTPAPKEKNLYAKLGQRVEEGAAGFRDELTSKPDLMTPTRLFLRPVGAAGRAVGDVADAIFSPIFDKTVDVISDIPAVQKLANTKPVSGGLDAVNEGIQSGVDQYGKFKEANPELAQDVEDVAGGANLVGLGLAKKPVTTALGKVIPEASEATIASRVASDFNKGIKPKVPTGSLGQMNKQNDQVVEAVRLINENAPNLSFVDEAGEAISGRTPKTRMELAEAVDQTKKNIFSQYDSLAKEAGDIGLSIQTKPIVSELDSLVKNESLQLTNPQAVTYAQQMMDRYANIKSLSPQVVQDVVKNLNESLKAFYRNPNYAEASKAAIDALVANNLRKMLDEGIEGLTGEQYSMLKKQYGALKAIEQDVLKAASKEAKQSGKGLIDYTDIFTGGDILHGVLTMNPAVVARGAFARGIKEFYKYMNDPNRAIEGMFKNAGKLPTRLFEAPKRPEPLQLPAPGESSFKEPGATLFSTPGGRATPNIQEAVDINAVEKGAATQPKAGPYYQQRVREIQNRLEQYFTPQEMAVIQMGPKPRSKPSSLPTAPDVPPAVYSSIVNRLEKYLTPEEMEIIQWGPKPKARLFDGPTIEF